MGKSISEQQDRCSKACLISPVKNGCHEQLSGISPKKEG
ncbi:hypothetical protein B4113_1866 [Geobacillus sp. B4113_201601]|nr:hypothetical protein B4113_1866 [Geobacillus sp. B4113_201601]